MRRQDHRIISKRGQKYELDRQNWSPCSDFYQMSENIASEMVDAGIAVTLDKLVLIDKVGNVVSTKKTLSDSLLHARSFILVMQHLWMNLVVTSCKKVIIMLGE